MVTAKSILRAWKENEILNFSPYLLVPLDTLISLPPSSLMPYSMFTWRKNETGKTEEKQWLMKRTREKWQFLWMEPLATRCFQGSWPQYSNTSSCFQKFLWRVTDCTKLHPGQFAICTIKNGMPFLYHFSRLLLFFSETQERKHNEYCLVTTIIRSWSSEENPFKVLNIKWQQKSLIALKSNYVHSLWSNLIF